MKVTFIHLDLGIGGAERLVVDSGVALKNAGHTVDFITSHHDRSHCFPETKSQLPVTVVGDWLPRSIFGKFYVLCSILRMFYISLYLLMARRGAEKPDVIFVDQVAQCIPFLRFVGVPVLFYCHHPDCLLVQRRSALRDFYRKPIDWFEEYTTSLADIIVVNSRYTERVFRKTFRALSHIPLEVIYPTVNFSLFDSPLDESCLENLPQLRDQKLTTFLSINRYERKKRIGLALSAMQYALHNGGRNLHLVIAGGFDSANVENVEHYEELVRYAKMLQIEDHVTFLKSPTDKQKQLLMHLCSAVVYTPENEHFGIVPIEAMYSRRPVIATNTGGPLETIEHNATGFLCEPSESAFGQAMLEIAADPERKVEEMGNAGKRRVLTLFSFEAFQRGLCDLLEKLVSPPPDRRKKQR